jgi:hypothetical protein
MAIVQIPLLGRARRSAGEMTFTKWKDKNVLKNKASNVSNPNTVNQQMARGMFATLILFGRALLPVFDLGFVAYRNVMSQFNAFVKYNYGVLVTGGVAPAFNTNIKDMVISKGPLTPTAFTNGTSANLSANVVITWPAAVTAPDQAPTDLVRVIVYNETSNTHLYNIGVVDRSAGTITLVLPVAAVTADVIDIYMFFSRSDGSIASDSRNLQITTV